MEANAGANRRARPLHSSRAIVARPSRAGRRPRRCFGPWVLRRGSAAHPGRPLPDPSFGERVPRARRCRTEVSDTTPRCGVDDDDNPFRNTEGSRGWCSRLLSVGCPRLRGSPGPERHLGNKTWLGRRMHGAGAPRAVDPHLVLLLAARIQRRGRIPAVIRAMDVVLRREPSQPYATFVKALMLAFAGDPRVLPLCRRPGRIPTPGRPRSRVLGGHGDARARRVDVEH